MNIERKWAGRWINAGSTMGTPVTSILPAPYLRKTFDCENTPQQATIFLCGLGWHVLYVNNQKADDFHNAVDVTEKVRFGGLEGLGLDCQSLHVSVSAHALGPCATASRNDKATGQEGVSLFFLNAVRLTRQKTFVDLNGAVK